MGLLFHIIDLSFHPESPVPCPPALPDDLDGLLVLLPVQVRGVHEEHLVLRGGGLLRVLQPPQPLRVAAVHLHGVHGVHGVRGAVRVRPRAGGLWEGGRYSGCLVMEGDEMKRKCRTGNNSGIWFMNGMELS